MIEAPPNGMPQFYPSLTYRDALAAIAWLKDAFGFEEVMVHTGEGERPRQVEHAELRFGTGVLMLGSPRPDRRWQDQQTPYSYVADVDGHCARAKAAGAKVTTEPHDNDYGGRGYAVQDLEGNEWFFGSYVPGTD
jgi:uncharacterized glyoxalase superfamily protein PhnB